MNGAEARLRDIDALIDAAKAYLGVNPAFRLRPIGGPGSEARLRQEDQIAAEDALRRAIENVEARR